MDTMTLTEIAELCLLITALIYFVWKFIDRTKNSGDKDISQDQLINDLRKDLDNTIKEHDKLEKEFHSYKSEIKSDFEKVYTKLDTINNNIIELASKIK